MEVTIIFFLGIMSAWSHYECWQSDPGYCKGAVIDVPMDGDNEASSLHPCYCEKC